MTDVLEDTRVEQRLRLGKPWTLIVWDDPVNLMTYVTWVFTSYFGFPKPKSERLMMQVHTEGRAAVVSGTREEMERHVEAMHGYGLQATLQQVDG
ncbi:MAG TPA: ATP-dependent Clp protease adapter ClpS [Amnibacterium sp.]|nr:ATP-dependent Clp protease adapter ClpS [Amnibacterium sp.]